MPTLDVFNSDVFSLRSLVAAIEALPYQPGRIGELGLFASSGIFTTTVQVEEIDGILSLIATSPYGAPAPDPLGASKRRMRPFNVPHLARESKIFAAEVQGIRSFGTESEAQLVQALVNQRLSQLRAMHEVTLEYHRMGAIQGKILDADGTSTVVDLFSEFGKSQQTHDFNLSTATLDVRGRCTAALRLIEAELGGSTYSGARALCSSGFFDTFVGHAIVMQSFQYQEGMVLRSDLRRGFVYGGITWEEYRGSVNKPDGSAAVDFIAANTAYLIPEGVQTVLGPLFQTYNAPADFEETVNTLGLPMYAKIARDPEFQRWVKIHSQSNPLNLCLKPRAVIKLTKS
jgi:hypothetical protein